MTVDDLKDRTLEQIPGGRAQFGPLTILILGAILSAVVTHYVEKCLNHIDPQSLKHPSWWERFQLRRTVRRACHDAEHLDAARSLGVHGKDLDTAYGDQLHTALLAMAASLAPTDLLSLKAGR